MDVRPEDKKKIIDLVSAVLPNAKIYVYGSRARGDHYKGSDVDIAVDTGTRIDYAKLGEIRSLLTVSHILYRVDVTDYSAASGKFKMLIDQDKVVWKN